MAYAELLCEAALLNGAGRAFGKNGEERSWADVRDMTARIATGLATHFALERGARVAILMGVSPDHVLLTFALSWLGVTVVPINTRLGTEDMRAVVARGDVELLFRDEANACRAADLVKATGLAQSVEVDAALLAKLAEETGCVRAQWSDDEVAALVFTGGTTGPPKGVVLTQAVMRAMARLFGAEMGYGPDTVYLSSMPIYHVGGLGQLLGVTASGGCHIFDPESGPPAIYRQLREEGVNTIVAVPTTLAMLLDSPLREDGLLAQITTVGYGASGISQPLLERLLVALPNAGFRQFYGQTETAGYATALRPEYHVLNGANAGHLASCGHVCSGMEVQTHDTSGNPTPIGVAGEVVVRSDSLPPGYWRDPERTAELYRDGWLHTGDVGVFDADGFLTIVDRLKDMIITGGENVFCTEVENVIARHPEVEACAVVGVPDQRWGEAVHAVVVVRAGSIVREADLKAFFAERLASFKRPKSIEITTDPLPLSGVGKVMKTILRDRWLAKQSAIMAPTEKQNAARNLHL
jgi:acyl-CoA synthetase (AMP-forming)/AMP-acid ligase II